MARKRTQVTEVNDVAYRYANYDSPFWVRTSSEPMRWHIPEDGPTQYLSLSSDGAWSELIRAEELTSEDEITMVRMKFWQVRVSQSKIVDYSNFAIAETCGFSPEALIDDDYERCQREGRRLRNEGYNGVLAPSAALPGATNLTLFGKRVRIAWDNTPPLCSTVPAQVLVRGAPPPGLVNKVRFKGQTHDDYEGYLKSQKD